MKKTIQLDDSWLAEIADQFDQAYMQQLRAFLLQEKQAGKVIYPASKNIFTALNTTAFDNVKVVILGQDPYHGEGQAHGLSFSVPDGVKIPPSLRNMYKELQRDLDIPMSDSGNLLRWAQQGVLLLNSVLTVEQAQAASHQGKGWEQLTDRIMQVLNERHEHLVFLLWGAHAQKKGALINTDKHLVLKTTHPSPLSAHRGFLGCGHFSQTNEYLQQHGKQPITW